MVSLLPTIAAAAANQCPGFSSGSWCYTNHDNRITTSNVTAADECCSLCTSTKGCVSWTAWGSPMQCNVYKTVVEKASGECTSGAATKGKMNFVFLFPDTLRAESFNAYGLKVPGVTPNADRMAAQGTLFESAHVMHTQCSPSRCTMLTGRYMHVDGHRTQTHLIQDYEPNYLRALKESGYHIQYYGKNDALSKTAFNLSVSEWENTIGYSSGSNKFTYGEAGYFSFLSKGGSQLGNSTKNADYMAAVDAVQWMSNSPPEPFLVFIPSRGAHPPYGAPADYHNKFPPELVKKHMQLRPRNIEGMPTYMQNKDGIPHYRNLTYLSDDVFYQIQSVYLGMISYTDWILGQLIDGIDAAPGGLSDRTAIFFSSDHGDFAGDYGLVEKWPGSMADVLTRVPAIVRIPGGVKGFVSQSPIQTADLLETMLDLADIKADWVRFASSLRPQLQSGQEGDMSRFVYSEGGFYFSNEQMNEANECLGQCSSSPPGLYCPRGQEEAQPNGSPRAVMMRNYTAKLVYRPTGVSELYDLVTDPRETQNLYNVPSASSLRAELKEKLLDWEVLTSDTTPVFTDSRGTPKYPPRPMPKGDPWASTNVWQADYLKVNGVLQED